MIYLHREAVRQHLGPGRENGDGGGVGIKRAVAYLFSALLAGGVVARLLAG
jgi:hypothetical protein